MSEFRRRLMMQAESDPNALPAGCVRCEYLESYLDSNNTKGQYIDTGSPIRSTDVIYVKLSFYKQTTDRTCFGWRRYGTALNGCDCILNLTTDSYYLLYGIHGSFVNKKTVTYEDIIEVYIDPNEKKVEFNGVKDSSVRDYSLPYYDGTSVYNFYLFNANAMGSPWSGSNVRIHEYILRDRDGNYVQHFVPILDANGKPCMYDLVTKRFFYNKRTERAEDFRYKILEQ
jgi:hypothetical protein